MAAKVNDPIQEQLIEARQNQILDAATQVFAEKGFHGATIRDVARAAGIADGTIYNYFENKTALLLGILNRLNQTGQREGHFEAVMETPIDYRTFMHQYLRQRYEVMTKQGFEVFQIVLSEVLVNAELRDLYYRQVILPTLTLTERFLREWIDQGVIKPIDTALWMRAVAGMTLGMVVLRLLGDEELEARWDDVPDFLADFILEGIEPTDTAEHTENSS